MSSTDRPPGRPGSTPVEPESRETGSGRRTALVVIALHGASSFGLGMVFPFIGIFLAGQDSIGAGGVALYYGMNGLANMVFGMLLATGVLRLERHVLAVTGSALSMVGYLVLAGATSIEVVGVAGLANGAGHGCFLAAIVPIINALIDENERRQIFARRYQVLNVTLAAGSLVAGLALTALSRDFLRTLFVINAMGYVPITAVLLIIRRRATVLGSVDPAPATSLSIVSLLRRVAGPAAFQLGAFLFGYSQFEATVPLVADTILSVELGWISMLVAVNVMIIVTAQSTVTRLLTGRPEAYGLRIATAVWAAGFLAAAGLAQGPPPMQIAGLLLFAAAFGLGECAYSCSFHPWLIARVPDSDLTRASGLVNSAMAVGLFSGPSIGVALVSTGNASVVFASLAVLAAGITITTVPRGLATRGARLRRGLAPRART